MRWTFTMDSEGWLTIYRNGAAVWEGTYEAFCADGDIRPPSDVLERIADRYFALEA